MPALQMPAVQSRALPQECVLFVLIGTCWNIPGLFYGGMSLTEDIDSGTFPFTVRMASIRPILFSALFCFVLLSWINRERLIHFSRKTGCTKILQVTMKQTCSRTIIFIKGPNNMCGRHLHGVAALLLQVSVSSDVKSGPLPLTSCPPWGATEHAVPRTCRSRAPSTVLASYWCACGTHSHLEQGIYSDLENKTLCYGNVQVHFRAETVSRFPLFPTIAPLQQ